MHRKLNIALVITALGAVCAPLSAVSADAGSTAGSIPTDCVNRGTYYECGATAPIVVPGPHTSAPQTTTANPRGATATWSGSSSPGAVSPDGVTTGSNYCLYTNDTAYTDWNYEDSSKDNASAGPLNSTFDAKVFTSSQVAPGSFGSSSLFYDSQWADATDGHRFTWHGGGGVGNVGGEIIVTWHVGGFMQTNTEGSPAGVPAQPPGAGGSEATGQLQVNIGVYDETSGSDVGYNTDAVFYRDDSAAGDQSQVYEKNGTDTFPLTYNVGDLYRPFVQMSANSSARAGYLLIAGIPYTFDANSDVDFFDGQGGGFMDQVEYEFNLPAGYILTCS